MTSVLEHYHILIDENCLRTSRLIYTLNGLDEILKFTVSAIVSTTGVTENNYILLRWLLTTIFLL